jgi:hypothetical protein
VERVGMSLGLYIIPPLAARISYRRLAVRAGMSKPGLHNKPARCGAAKTYALDPGSEEEEASIICIRGVTYCNNCSKFISWD